MNKKVPLLQYWTRRYVIILFTSLLVVGVLSGVWINRSTKENRLKIIEVYAQSIAEKIAPYLNDRNSATINKQVRQREKNFFEKKTIMKNTDLHFRIVNENGDILFEHNPFSDTVPILSSSTEQQTQKWQDNKGKTWYEIATPILQEDKAFGVLYVIVPDQALFGKTDITKYWYVLIFLITLGFAGWFVIYLLSKKLSTPIQKLAIAAEQISVGKYDVQIDEGLAEQELYELSTSFQMMTKRLRELEELRTVLLAGVTHELKTPVTSISGLIQAVRDKVVTGQEADEFLEMSLTQATRLQDMVNELLDFNAFASGVFQVNVSVFSLQTLFHEIEQQWKIGKENEAVTLEIDTPKQELFVKADQNRTQQILLNLLNNARDASKEQIFIRLTATDEMKDTYAVRVTDYGVGIQVDEQRHIFERFFRGDNKKYQKRGLGLGLPMSKMLAEAMGGSLVLESSIPNKETTFLLRLPKVK